LTGRIHAELGDDNQDSFGVVTAEEAGAVVLGVFDGHGHDGKILSELAKKNALNGCRRQLNEGVPAEEVLRKVFHEVGQDIDATECSVESGTTATVAIVEESRIVCGYVGDSSASFSLLDEDLRLEDTGLLFEAHRATNTKEAKRILETGCLIDGSYVVDHSRPDNVIALTRAFGDKNMRKCSVISAAEIAPVRELPAKSDSLLVLATDGLWDQPKATALEVHTCISRILRSGYTLADACERLMQLNGPPPGDDCTVIVARMNRKASGS